MGPEVPCKHVQETLFLQAACVASSNVAKHGAAGSVQVPFGVSAGLRRTSVPLKPGALLVQLLLVRVVALEPDRGAVHRPVGAVADQLVARLVVRIGRPRATPDVVDVEVVEALGVPEVV